MNTSIRRALTNGKNDKEKNTFHFIDYQHTFMRLRRGKAGRNRRSQNRARGYGRACYEQSENLRPGYL